MQDSLKFKKKSTIKSTIRNASLAALPINKRLVIPEKVRPAQLDYPGRILDGLQSLQREPLRDWHNGGAFQHVLCIAR